MSRGLAIVFAEEYYECLELHYPRLRLLEAGYDVKVVGPQKDVTYKSKEGYWAKSTHTVSELNAGDVKVVVIPGGWCCDRLRRFPEINIFLTACWNEGNGAIVGFICHGGWLPISAKILKGRKVTSFFAIKDDLVNAGAEWVDDRVVVDGRMVSSQMPDDLPGFMKAILQVADGTA
eukprot:PhM_4_TR14979/c0_g1_i1/m.2552/K05520/pfpI; protease I